MIAALVIFIIISVIFFSLFLMQRQEMRSMEAQLKSFAGKDSNELLHSKNGGGDAVRLIDEINRLLKQVRYIKISYRKKSHELEQMMTNISHDLRTPLTSAMGYINMIQNQDMPEEEREKELNIVYMRLIRLEELINSFFEFSKVISGGETPEIKELNLVQVLEDAIVHYYDDFCGQDREIELLCQMQRINIRSNRQLLVRIFDNLISNAYKHGTANLKISIEETAALKTQVEGKEYITIRFENELTDAQMEIDRVFDEFYTTDISRTKGNSGLGLAIAKQFAELLDIRLTADYDGEIFSVTAYLQKNN